MSLPLDVAPLIGQFNSGPLVVSRRAKPVRNASTGVMEPQAATTVQIGPAAVHTVTGRELMALPEADRAKDVRRFYTQQRIYVAGSGVYEADVITYQGNRYRAKIAHDYASNGGAWIVDAVRMEGAEA